VIGTSFDLVPYAYYNKQEELDGYSIDIVKLIQKQLEQEHFMLSHGLLPLSSKVALDCGAGNGIQSVSMAKLGFEVQAIDFNQQLLDELNERKGVLPIEVIADDIVHIKKYGRLHPELIVCCGDTISHLDSQAVIKTFLDDCYSILEPEGKLLLSFRDYSTPLTDTSRFLPVKSTADRILTCFLEYEDGKVRVTDILYEKREEGWQQSASSYFKVRVSKAFIEDSVVKSGFKIVGIDESKGMIALIAQKGISS